MPSWDLPGRAWPRLAERLQVNTGRGGPGRAGLAAILGLPQPQPSSSTVNWLPGSLWPIPHHIRTLRWETQVPEARICEGSSREVPREPHVLPSFPWSPRKRGCISQPAHPPSGSSSVWAPLAEPPTLLLVAVRQDSSHGGPHPARLSSELLFQRSSPAKALYLLPGWGMATAVRRAHASRVPTMC